MDGDEAPPAVGAVDDKGSRESSLGGEDDDSPEDPAVAVNDDFFGIVVVVLTSSESWESIALKTDVITRDLKLTVDLKLATHASLSMLVYEYVDGISKSTLNHQTFLGGKSDGSDQRLITFSDLAMDHQAASMNLSASRQEPLHPEPLHMLRVVGLLFMVTNITILWFWQTWHLRDDETSDRPERYLVDDELYLGSDAALTTMLDMGRI